MTHPPLRVAVWCAVSSQAQATADKGSLADQERAGRDFATAIGGEVVAVYTVPGHSRNLIFWHDAEATMPAYRQLHEDCQRHDIDVLHAIDMDRLGRDPALANQVVSLVEQSGAEVYIASAPHQIGTANTGQRYVHAIQMVRAKEDTDLRVRRSLAGKRNRKARGLPLYWPHGYTPTRDPNTGRVTTATLDPAAAPAIQLITVRFLAGDSFASIARQLDDAGYQPPRSHRWTSATCYNTLHNDIYAGRLTWHGETVSTAPRYPPLWNPETYAAILAERQHRRDHPRRKRQGGPLHGIAYCNRCGGTMTRLHNRSSYSIRCTTHATQCVTGISCHANQLTEARVFAVLAAWLQPLTDPAALASALQPDDSTAATAARLDAIASQFSDIDTQRQRLALAYAAGRMELAIYHTTDLRLQDQRARLEAEHAELETIAALLPTPETAAASIAALLPILPDVAATLPGPEVRALLTSLRLQILIEDREVVLIRFTPLAC